VAWVLLSLAAAGLLAYVLFRRSRGPTSVRVDDQCPLDRFSGSGQPDRAARESTQQRTRPNLSGERTPPLPEDQIHPSLRSAVRKLSSTVPTVVVEGAQELGESGRADAVPPLLSALRIRLRSVYFGVAAALLRLGTPSVGPLQQALATEHDAELRGLLTRLLEQFDRQAKGLELAPIEAIVGIPSELGDELARGWLSN
jgi:hypothetical protein